MNFAMVSIDWLIKNVPVDEVLNGHHLPAFGDGADFSLFLGFVAEAFGEELVHEGLFQLGGGLNDPLLRFDRPLHRRKDVRDLLLLGDCRWQPDWLHVGHFSVQAGNANVSGYSP